VFMELRNGAWFAILRLNARGTDTTIWPLPEEKENAEARITRHQQDGKAGGGSGEETPSPRNRTRRGNLPDREGLPDLPRGTVPGRPTSRELSVPGAYRLRKNTHRRGDRRVPAEESSSGNQDRLRGVSTQP